MDQHLSSLVSMQDFASEDWSVSLGCEASRCVIFFDKNLNFLHIVFLSTVYITVNLQNAETLQKAKTEVTV